MPVVKTELEMRLYTALKRITQYDSPDRIRRFAERDYGLHDSEEALEYAYENMQSEAKSALKGVRLRKMSTPG